MGWFAHWFGTNTPMSFRSGVSAGVPLKIVPKIGGGLPSRRYAETHDPQRVNESHRPWASGRGFSKFDSVFDRARLLFDRPRLRCVQSTFGIAASAS